MRKYRLEKFIKIKGAKNLQFVICWHCGALIESGLACNSGEEVICLRCNKEKVKSTHLLNKKRI